MRGAHCVSLDPVSTHPREPAQSLATTDTIYSADSIEWCPHPGSEGILVCGTYQVLEPRPGEASGSADAPAEPDSESDDEGAEQSGPRQTERTGRLLVFRVGEDESSL
jgi:diphthamide biosynthesis protein 7